MIFWHYGLRGGPDLDTVTYTLGGLVDPANGWGVAGDTTPCSTPCALRRGAVVSPGRPGHGDACAPQRMAACRRDADRSDAAIDKRLGINQRLLPMTDAPVATMIETVEHGDLAFQDYFVRFRWQPTIKRIRFDGLRSARDPGS